MNTTSVKTKFTYFAVVLFLTSATYFVCDYYLAAIGKELVLSWAQSEASAIQEGNVLTSITTAQRFLLSSDYIKGVALLKREDNLLKPRIEFGQSIDYSPNELNDLQDGINGKRVGFLHQRIYFKLPSQKQFILIFDVNSYFLSFIFLGFSSVLILAVVYLIWTLQKVERFESRKREDLIKLAIDNLLQKEVPSPVLAKEIPGLLKWWTIKQSEIESARSLAVANQSKIAFGELASITAHDIKSSLRNIREIAKLVTGISDKQKYILTSSIEKVSDIASNLLVQTQDMQRVEIATRSKTNLAAVVSDVVNFKQNQYGIMVDIQIKLDNVELSTPLNRQELERTLHNLIDNAVEASKAESTIWLTVSQIEHLALIQVIDKGKGIPNEAMAMVGTKGYTSGKSNGTGLGLFYAKQFAEAIGGRVQINSELGIGTKVSIYIPNDALHSRTNQIEPFQ